MPHLMLVSFYGELDILLAHFNPWITVCTTCCLQLAGIHPLPAHTLMTFLSGANLFSNKPIKGAF